MAVHDYSFSFFHIFVAAYLTLKRTTSPNWKNVVELRKNNSTTTGIEGKRNHCVSSVGSRVG